MTRKIHLFYLILKLNLKKISSTRTPKTDINMYIYFVFQLNLWCLRKLNKTKFKSKRKKNDESIFDDLDIIMQRLKTKS